MSHLMLLDFDPTVVAVAGQPFRLRFGQKDAPYSHVPDVFARYADGSAVVLDVKGALATSTEKNRKVFGRTAEALAELGMGYRIATEPDPVLMSNVRWLAGYRRPQHLTDEVRLHIADAAETGTVKAVTTRAARSAGLPEAVIRPVLFHLMWHRLLVADLGRLIDNDTVLTLADGNGNRLNRRAVA